MSNLSSILHALSNPIRMELCKLMLEHAGELSVDKLVERVNARLHCKYTQPTISHHIGILRANGLISCQRDGLYSYYSFERGPYEQALSALYACLPVRATAEVA